MKKACFFLILSFVLSLYSKADALTDYRTIFQDGQIKIIFTLAANDKDNTLPVFSVKFTGELEGKKPFALKTMTGSGTSGIVIGAGVHTNLWNVSKDKRRFNPGDIKIKIEAEDVTEHADYLCVDLKKGTIKYQSSQPEISKNQCRTKELWLRRIEPGVFMMGSPTNEMGRLGDETQHEVKISKAFYISIFETTQSQFKSIMKSSKVKPYFKGATSPMDSVSYDVIRGDTLGRNWPQSAAIDNEVIIGYKKKWYEDEDGERYYDEIPIYGSTFLGGLRGKTGGELLFDLPTEAQWEYACRAGSEKAFSNETDPVGETDPNLDKLGWYKDNSFDKRISGKASHTVGEKAPNGFGLYDMHGNVSEWCLDWYGEYGTKKQVDPAGAKTGYYRVVRGGNCYSDAFYCRSASRSYWSYYYGSEEGQIGFRVALGLPTEGFEEDDDDEGDALTQKFDYYLSSPERFPVFTVKFYGKTERGVKYILEDTGTLSGDGASGIAFGNGVHSLVWKPFGPYTNLINKLELEVVSKNVTEKANYLVLDLNKNKMRTEINRPDDDSACKQTELWLKRVRPGTFMMGVAPDDVARRSDDTQREVTLENQFYMGVFEVTKKQYQLVTDTETISDDVADFPAEAVQPTPFFNKLLDKTGKKLRFSLPSEEQWEYSCRAGTTTSLNNGTNLTALDKCPNLDVLAWYSDNSDRKSHPVGGKLANAWGFYDMHGNVAERCLNGTSRGGAYNSEAKDCRSAGSNGGVQGFRVALNMEPTEPLFDKLSYTLESENSFPVFATKMYVVLEDGTKKYLEDMGTLSGDGAYGIVIGAGEHEIIWTPLLEYTNFVGKIDLKVDYEDLADRAKYLVWDIVENNIRVETEGPAPSDQNCLSGELWFRRIEPGIFVMGCPKDELGRSQGEKQHEVTLTKAFYMGVFEMTQAQYSFIAGYNPSTYSGLARPVENVSYDMIRGNNKGAAWPKNHEVDEYCNGHETFLGALRRLAGNKYWFDLPTEAQWEYACRAGKNTAWNNGTDIEDTKRDANLGTLGRYAGNQTDGKGESVLHANAGSYSPNAWGLYDMHGNVSEWCLDRYGLFNKLSAKDPRGEKKGDTRICRGGSWNADAVMCKSSRRDNKPSDAYDTGTGFRVVWLSDDKDEYNGNDFSLTETFTYDLTSDKGNLFPIFAAKIYAVSEDGERYLLEDIGLLSGDGADGIVFGEGEHTIVWSPLADYADLKGKLKLDVEYQDVTDQSKYLVLDLIDNEFRNEKKGPMENSDLLSKDTCRTEELWLRRIEPGTFNIGCPAGELGRNVGETRHTVTLTQPYYMSVFETTQEQYRRLTGENPSQYRGEIRPVENVSYEMIRGSKKGAAWPESYEVDDYFDEKPTFLGALRKVTGNRLQFDLPTEAQWEYACRAGKASSWNNGTNIEDLEQDSNLDKLGRYEHDKSDGKGGSAQHTKVGSYSPNDWGLYDMHGNAFEWCLDWYHEFYQLPTKNPRGTKTGDYRILRGGSWKSEAVVCKSDYRSGDLPNAVSDLCGFRVVLCSDNKDEYDDYDYSLYQNFEYTLPSETERWLPVFSVKFYVVLEDGTKYPLDEIGLISGDGSSGIVVGSGEHRIKWSPSPDYTNLIGKVEFDVEAEDITDQSKYLVLDLIDNELRNEKNGPMENNNLLSKDTCRTEELWLRRIEPGTFNIGSPAGELGRNVGETRHTVTLTQPYYMSVFETTQEQYRRLTGENPSQYRGEIRPVENVSYEMIRGSKKGAAWPESYEVDDYFDEKPTFLGALRKVTGNRLQFDLPTEAQWEYACRAGKASSWNNGTNIEDLEQDSNLDKLGRYEHDKSDGKGGSAQHTKVGSYSPNDWGLYDMHGNAFEWCLDWYHEFYQLPTKNPRGTKTGDYRILRGGSWKSEAVVCKSDYRSGDLPNAVSDLCGFRVVLCSDNKDEYDDYDYSLYQNFEYTLPSETERLLPVFSVKFYVVLEDGTEYPLDEIGLLSGDGSGGTVFGEGKHEITWRPSAAYTNLIGKVELRVDYKEGKANYLVVNLLDSSIRAEEYGPMEDSSILANNICRTSELWLRRIEPGKFNMGSPLGEPGRLSMETLHTVTLTKPFYIAVFETTQSQYKQLTGTNYSSYLGDDRPVEKVSYDMLRGDNLGSAWPKSSEVDEYYNEKPTFFGALRKLTGGNLLFDLPTEAQWEYACRAGNQTAWNDGTQIENTDTDRNLTVLGRYSKNRSEGKGGYYQHTRVGSYNPNAWGLYDMHGNVSEFCLDWYDNFSDESMTDPKGKEKGYFRVLRGGCWDDKASSCRSASRTSSRSSYTLNTHGFRVALILDED